MWQYRGGLRDSGVYFNSGKLILSRDNPYVPAESRWGTFGPLPFTLFLSIFPAEVHTQAVQLLTFLGAAIFTRSIFPKMKPDDFIFTYLLLIWSSPFRENLATNQMSCIVLGFIGVSLFILQKESKQIYDWMLASIPMAIALDLRPHTTIFLFIAASIYFRSTRLFFGTVSILLLAHLSINLSQGRILEIDWFNSLKTLNSAAQGNKLGDSVSFWPLLNHYLDAPSLFYAISIITTLVLFCILLLTVLARNISINWIALSFLIPAFSIYFHFYDLIALVAVGLGTVVLNRPNVYAVSLLSFILIPLEFSQFKNIFLYIALTSLYILFKGINKKSIKALVFGNLVALVVRLLSLRLELDARITQSLMVSLSVILLVGLIFSANCNKRITLP
jgi:hypothetical protein